MIKPIAKQATVIATINIFEHDKELLEQLDNLLYFETVPDNFKVNIKRLLRTIELERKDESASSEG